MSSKAFDSVLQILGTPLEKSSSEEQYTAFQRMRSLATRTRGRMNAPGVELAQKEDLCRTVARASICLCKNAQWACAMELALLWVNTCVDLGIAYTRSDSVRGSAKEMVRCMKGIPETQLYLRRKFLDQLLSYTQDASGSVDGQLLFEVAQMESEERLFDSAESRLMSCGSEQAIRLLAENYINWNRYSEADCSSEGQSKSGSASAVEHDPETQWGAFAVRGVLSLLLARQVAAAESFLKHYLTLLPEGLPRSASASQPNDVIEYKDTALTWIQMLLSLVRRTDLKSPKSQSQSLIVYKQLMETFMKDLVMAQDQTQTAMTTIGQDYFGAQAPRNFLQDMLGGLMGGGPPSVPSSQRSLPAAAHVIEDSELD